MDINGLLTQMLCKGAGLADAPAGPNQKNNLQAKVACERPRRRLKRAPFRPRRRRTVTFPRSESGAAESGQMKRVYLTFAGCLMSRSPPVPQSFRSESLLCTLLGHEAALKRGVRAVSTIRDTCKPSPVAQEAI